MANSADELASAGHTTLTIGGLATEGSDGWIARPMRQATQARLEPDRARRSLAWPRSSPRRWIGPSARLATRLQALRSAVLEGKGTTDVAARRAAFSGQPLQEPLDQYLRKVRSASYQLTDADIQRLRSAGVAEDAIFELTIADALGAAERGLRVGLMALGETAGG